MTDEERRFLEHLATRSGVIFVREREREISLALHPREWVAIGEDFGTALPVQITAEGRAALREPA